MTVLFVKFLRYFKVYNFFIISTSQNQFGKTKKSLCGVLFLSYETERKEKNGS